MFVTEVDRKTIVITSYYPFGEQNRVMHRVKKIRKDWRTFHWKLAT